MQEICLTLNDTLVDLPADIARQLRLSKSGTDASDLESRRAEVSYTLTLPPTRTNHTLFANAAEHARARKFYRADPITAVLEVGGQVLLSGGFRLTSIQGGYSGQLYAGEVDLFAALGEKKLSELQFTPWAYRGGEDFSQMLDLPVGEGPVCWPLVAYGNFFAEGSSAVVPLGQAGTPSRLEQDDYTPSVYLTAILKQIFADQGWQAVGEPLEDAFWKSVCLPFTGEEYPWNWGELLKLEAASAQINGGNWYSQPEPEEDGKVSKHYIVQPEATYNPVQRYRGFTGTSESGAPIGWNSYQVRRGGLYDISFTLTVDLLTNNSGVPFALQLLRVPVGEALYAGEVLAEQAIPNNGVGTYTLTALGMLEETDQLLPVLMYRTDNLLSATQAVTLSDIVYTITPTEEVGPFTIELAKSLPDWSQRDLVKAFCAMANLRFSLDTVRQVIAFYFRDRYELPADYAVDLTGLADPLQSKYAPVVAARTFAFRYAEDKGDVVAERGAADLVLDTYNSATASEQALQLPFAATGMRTYRRYLGNNAWHTFELPCMASAEQLETPLNEVSWSYGYVPRLVVYTGKSQGYNDQLSLNFVDTSGSDGLHAYGKATVEGLGWPELYAAYYSGYLEALRDGHVTTNTFMLSPALYRQLSPMRLVLFDGLLYRLGKVAGYQPASPGTTEVELLYLPETAFGGGRAQGAPLGAGREFYGGEFDPAEWY